jgi:hypothetical protein
VNFVAIPTCDTCKCATSALAGIKGFDILDLHDMISTLSAPGKKEILIARDLYATKYYLSG